MFWCSFSQCAMWPGNLTAFKQERSRVEALPAECSLLWLFARCRKSLLAFIAQPNVKRSSVYVSALSCCGATGGSCLFNIKENVTSPLVLSSIDLDWLLWHYVITISVMFLDVCCERCRPWWRFLCLKQREEGRYQDQRLSTMCPWSGHKYSSRIKAKAAL